MQKVEFPAPLKRLLDGSELQPGVRALADRVGQILADNQLPFFPDYTDHGIDHIHCVLKSEVELVPREVWENSKPESAPPLLVAADAAVLIGATLLHDIAMHVRPDGFLELVDPGSRFKPLPWFDRDHEGHEADRPWHELWADYGAEARRLSDRDLTDVIGEESAATWRFTGLPKDTGQWERNHCLIIGEFIRRHHARLAHEIAIYGFPGLPAGHGPDQFPAMGTEPGHPLARMADLVGLAARSHWKSLRLCKAYMDERYTAAPRPMGSAALYAMALLRVADYLQIDAMRAPPVLLQLRNPPSPISVQEWKKHRAVQDVGPSADPRGKLVTVAADISLPLYLDLQDVLAGLQAEIDHSTAVLDESYGTRSDLGLNHLNLALRRVHSNLNTPAFRKSLPYVPQRTGFSADPHLLTLLVEPLYGNEPGVGVRELIQNAVDAVRELMAWCDLHGTPMDTLELPQQDPDVLVEFIQRPDATWLLRVRDKGIGMTGDTIDRYFLRAGASFRRSQEWAREFVDAEGQARVARAGRFGVGAFATFLLGPSFRLTTRHAAAALSDGYAITATANNQSVTIERICGLPVGTSIEVTIAAAAATALGVGKDRPRTIQRHIDWYCWSDLDVMVIIRTPGKRTEVIPQYTCPVPSDHIPPDWSLVAHRGFDAIYWTWTEAPTISCNGIRIKSGRGNDAVFRWPERLGAAPSVAVVDSAGNLPLTVTRYGLSKRTLPFHEALERDVALSVIAHALICGPQSQTAALALRTGHPLRRRGRPHVQWCSTSTHYVPTESSLLTLLQADLYCGYGRVVRYGTFDSDLDHPDVRAAVVALAEEHRAATIQWRHETSIDKWPSTFLDPIRFSKRLCMALDEQLVCSEIVLSHRSDATRSGKPWQESPIAPTAGRRWIYSGGSAVRAASLLRGIEAALGYASEGNPDRPEAGPRGMRERAGEGLYVAFLSAGESREPSPESLLSRVWKECLGPVSMPFDAGERKALLAQASKHPGLKHHIDAWREMKGSGSKWASQE